MKKYTFLVLSFLLLTFSIFFLRQKIVTELQKENVTVHLKDLFRSLDLDGEIKVGKISLLFMKDFKLRINNIDFNNKKNDFTAKIDRIDILIPYVNFFFEKRQPLHVVWEDVQLPNYSKLSAWYADYSKRRQEDHKLEVFIPSYLRSDSYNVSIHNIKIQNANDFHLEKILFRGLGSALKSTFEVKFQSNINWLDFQFNAKSVLIGEAQNHDFKSLSANFNMRSQITFIKPSYLEREYLVEGVFMFQPSSLFKFSSSISSEGPTGKLNIDLVDSKFKSDIEFKNVPSVFGRLFFPLRQSIFEPDELGDFLVQINSDEKLMSWTSLDGASFIQRKTNQFDQLDSLELSNPNLSLSYKNDKLFFSSQWWNQLTIPDRFDVIQDIIANMTKFQTRPKQLLVTSGDKEFQILNLEKQSGPCLLDSSFCSVDKTRSIWRKSDGEWDELWFNHSQINIKNLSMIKDISQFNLGQPSEVYFQKKEEGIMTRIKFSSGQKLIEIPFFKEKLFVKFSQEKEINSILSSKIIQDFEVKINEANIWSGELKLGHLNQTYLLILTDFNQLHFMLKKQSNKTWKTIFSSE